MKKKTPTRKKRTIKQIVKRQGKAKTAPLKKKASSRISHAAGMHDAREVVRERRYEVRTLVTNMTFVAVSFQIQKFGAAGFTFVPDLSGLLIDTSQGGCSLIFMQANPMAAKLNLEVQCLVQIAPAEPRLATVRWVKNFDGRLRNAGLAFS